MSIRTPRLTTVGYSQCLSIIPPDFSTPSPSDPSIGTELLIITKNRIPKLYLPLHIEECNKYDTFSLYQKVSRDQLTRQLVLNLLHVYSKVSLVNEDINSAQILHFKRTKI